MRGDEYRTPDHIWQPLHEAFDFVLDAAASDQNRLVTRYYGHSTVFGSFKDALTADWASDADGGFIWCNPPYSKAAGPLQRWVEKALDEALRGARICMLLPADTSTRWFHLLWDDGNGVWSTGVEGHFLEKRVRFINPATGGPEGSPQFGSLVVIITEPEP